MSAFRMEAHRGLSSYAPESTFIALREAVDEGFSMAELDVSFTADGRAVILHDETLNRTARGRDGSPPAATLPLSSLTLTQAREYDYGIWRGERFAGQELMTLEQALDFSAESGLSLKLDNRLERYTPEQTERFIEILKAAARPELIGITCKTPSVLARYAALLPQCELHYDGALDDGSLTHVAESATGHRLTIWTCYPCPATEWYKGERADPVLCDRIRAYGEVGVWMLTDICQLADAICNLRADIVETDGSVRPMDVFEI